jgi:hypothetical protein
LNLRKMVVTGVLTCSLTLGSASAFAASLEDTIGLSNEVAINKLVSLGVFSSGKLFNPESDLTRGEFASIIQTLIPLKAGKEIAIKDVNTAKGANAKVVKLLNNGLLKLDANGKFNINQGVTYSELSRVLAYGLGLKLTWTDRPLDFLYYLDRKGVLDIDTDLDAVVTKEGAAAAIDKYITLKQLFTAEHGVINFLTEDGVVINNGRDTQNYVLAKNASLFVDGSSVAKSSLGSGTAVEVLLNAKGEIAYITGSSLMLEEGVASYADGKVTANGSKYNVDLNLVVAPLPNQPDSNFTFDNFGRYTGAGTSFMGNTYINTKTDEVTKLNLYISKIADRTVKVTGSVITADYSDMDFANQTFTASADVVVTLESGKEGEKGKVVTLAEIEALQTENTLTGTLEMNSIGEVTTITVKATVKEKQQ